MQRNMKWIVIGLIGIITIIRLFFYYCTFKVSNFFRFIWEFKTSNVQNWRQWSKGDYSQGEDTPIQTFRYWVKEMRE